MKKSTILYGFLAILGVVLLILVIEGTYLGNRHLLSILTLFSSRSSLGIGLCWGSVVLFTVGIVGVIRQYFKNHTILFTVFMFLSIFVLAYFSFGSFYNSMVLNPNNYPPSFMGSEMAKVTVVDTDPLVLCLNVKSITDFDTEIEKASISNNYGELAQVPSDEELVDSHSNFQPFTLAELPAGSEISLTLDFNTTLPSGSYDVSLDGWWLDGWVWINRNYGISPFTIP